MDNPLLIVIFTMMIKWLVSVEGDILASSKLDTCIVGSAQGEPEIECATKMIIALTVVTGQSGQSDYIETYVTGVDDKQDVKRRLQNPYRIGIRKSDVFYRYPLEYLQNFNEKPYEYAFVSVNCEDDKGSNSPSCGWTKNAQGGNIDDSQGFCCKCSGEEGLPKWLGGKKRSKRFPVKCSWFQKTFFRKNNGSAHCLRFSPRWFTTFKMVENSLRFTITVIITEMNGTSAVLESIGSPEEVIVSPVTPIAVNSGKTIKVKLQGDFAAYTTAPMLYDRYLALPLIQGTQNVEGNANDWLALEKEKFTLDGLNCDRIGVSFHAFKFQYGACVSNPQSCLANQLEDFIKEDEGKRAVGQRPLYSVTQFGTVNTDNENSKLGLNIKAEISLTSVITLELVADGISFYRNRSPGKIIKASVEDFEALSRNGVLNVDVKNIGDLTADFTLAVLNCSDGIDMPDAKQISLPVPATIASYQFLLHSTDDQAKSRSCKVDLQDAVGATSDSIIVTFATTTTKYDNKSQDFAGEPQSHTNKSDSGWGFGIGWFDSLDIFGWLKLKSCDHCRLPNLLCFIWNFCWSELISTISEIASAVLVGLGIYLLWSSGLLWPAVKVLCIPCKLCCSITTSIANKATRRRRRRDSGYDDYSDEKRYCCIM